MKNDYNKIASLYQKTDIKPDKQFSILPTVLSLAGDLKNKVVLDLGCGSGFFTRAASKTASKVIGVDNSKEQLQLTSQDKEKNVEYQLLDFFKDSLPKSDLVITPFVFGYCKDVDQLEALLKNIYNSLSENGRLVGVLDLPTGQNLSRYGAIKILPNHVDGEIMEITLTDGESEICKLSARFYSTETIESILGKVGFKNIIWHKPIVSQEGIDAMPEGFWDGYVNNCELGYLTADKRD